MTPTLTFIKGIYLALVSVSLIIGAIILLIFERRFSRITKGDMEIRDRKDTMQMQRDIDEIINKFD